MSYEKAWLAYRPQKEDTQKKYVETLFCSSGGRIARTAAAELKQAARELFGIEPQERMTKSGLALEGKEEGVRRQTASFSLLLNKAAAVGEEGYRITEEDGALAVESAGEKGLLYGTFAVIRKLRLRESLQGIDETVKPDNPLRMLNHWDNMDGSIERGYAGNSFFFKEQKVIVNDRTRVYARLAASVGINAAVINNVNVRGRATWLLTKAYREELGRLAEIFADYGISLYLSLNFAAPMEIGGLDSADPLDERVVSWWKAQMKESFEGIPNLGGFLVKADSEGRPGPFTYQRTHADGANMLADAVAPYGGTIIWRCFVYNCQQDWRDKKTDRARAGYDNFMKLDGKFRENVILQIKNGPMDFQVREPVSPLFGGLRKTNQMLEVQLAQEYTGQQRHVCCLLPMFREILDFHTYCTEEKDTVAEIVSGKTFGQTVCGMAAVANTGDDENWTGHDLAAVNLYGFGRLAFQTGLSAEEIEKEWICCTFGQDPRVVHTILAILQMSWPAYEKYTSPLGIGWMVNPGHHYGPNVDGYEYDRWGTYHRADHEGIGVDRSRKGTGYAQQYQEPNASLYDNIETCPEELLLFFHHVPYTWKLKSGKTVIQHIYDTHFDGAEEAQEMADKWETLQDLLPEKCFRRVQQRMEHQKEHAKEWRDQINSYFYRKSFIPDEKGREIF